MVSKAFSSVLTNPRLAINGGDPVRTRPFAQACLIAGDERELLLDCLESQQWSGFRAGTNGLDMRRVGRMTSREIAALEPSEIQYLGGKYVRQIELLFADYAGTSFAVSANSATSCLIMAIGAL